MFIKLFLHACLLYKRFVTVNRKLAAEKSETDLPVIILQSLAKDHGQGVTSAESKSVLQLQQLKVQIFRYTSTIIICKVF